MRCESVPASGQERECPLPPQQTAPQESSMRNVYEVLQEKENAIQRVAREIKILRLAAPLLSEDVPSGAPTHDVHGHDAPAQNASTEDASTHDALINDVLSENALTLNFPHDIRDDDASTGIVSAPSRFTSDLHDAESDGQDEEDSDPGKKISGRLKRLVKPFVSFVAG